MIQSFADKHAADLFHRQRKYKRLPDQLQRQARQKLVQLDAATRIDDLRTPPGNRLEQLSGDRKGQHSIRINDQWRVCFRWRSSHAYDVEIVDYH